MKDYHEKLLSVGDATLVYVRDRCRGDAQCILENQRNKTPKREKDEERNDPPDNELLALLSFGRITCTRDELHDPPKKEDDGEEPEEIIQSLQGIQEECFKRKNIGDSHDGANKLP